MIETSGRDTTLSSTKKEKVVVAVGPTPYDAPIRPRVGRCRGGSPRRRGRRSFPPVSTSLVIGGPGRVLRQGPPRVPVVEWSPGSRRRRRRRERRGRSRVLGPPYTVIT